MNYLFKKLIFHRVKEIHPTKDQLRRHKNSQAAYKWQCVQTRCFAIRLDIKFNRSFLSKMLWRGLADVSSWSKQTWSLIGRRSNERILIGPTSSSRNQANPAQRPQFLADIWRCNDEIIKFIIRKFGGDLYWPDYHLRTAFFRILSENKLYILVELKDVVNFDGILYQSGLYGCFKSVLSTKNPVHPNKVDVGLRKRHSRWPIDRLALNLRHCGAGKIPQRRIKGDITCKKYIQTSQLSLSRPVVAKFQGLESIHLSNWRFCWHRGAKKGFQKHYKSR